MAKETQHSTLITLYLISITGPESTGKSSLAIALATHYGTVYAKEYSREYLKKIGRPYRYEDILLIAQGQYQQETRMINKAKKYLFCDTDMIVCKIWSEFRYGKADPWIIQMANDHRYDLYLLCDIDLPWKEDPLREHPHRRQELMDLYVNELERLRFPYQIVNGTGDKRTEKAISMIDHTFQEHIPEQE